MNLTERLFLAFLATALTSASLPAQTLQQASEVPSGQTESQEATKSDAIPTTIFRHPDDARYLVSGQANIVFQGHPGFHSPYEGANSLLSRGEYKVSLVGTLFTGLRIHRNLRYNTDAIFDMESSGGRGISEALGLAGFTNLDVVRNPQLGSKPYVARVQLHQTIGLTDKLIDAQKTQFSLATKVPERRFDLRAGRMSMPDVMDANGPGSDSHLQFLNWTVDNNGAWDYAADTRGYTYAVVAEYDDVDWSARYAIALMPTVANGIDLDWNLHRARGENYEIETRRTPWAALLPDSRKGTIRLLGYVNHGDMGLYRNAVKAFQAGLNPVPDVTAHTQATTVKYGVGLNFEQELTSDLRAFGRYGWNEGQHESFCYTEVDETFEVGADLAGTRWSRPQDRLGLAGVTNAIKRDHQQYLALGGKGFLLGDGRLNYGREDILEAYYNAHNWRGLFTAFDFQFIAHPGYNVDRGPVAVFTVRTHVDF